MSSPDSLTSAQDLDVINAKAFLQQQSAKNGESLYNHLTRLLTKILDERPNDVADVFEDLSRKVKIERFVSNQDTIVDRSETTAAALLAETHLKLLTNEGEAGQTEEEETIQSLPNLLEQHYYFEQAGVGLSVEEYVRLWLAMKALVVAQPIETIRFWGKIIGIRRNYFIVEVEFREGEGDEEEPEVEEANEEAVDRDNDAEEGEAEVDIIPKPTFKPPPVIPKEDNRTGVNKKTYFVCNEPGEPWNRLPLVTPVQISTARKIKKFFTGDLDAPIVSYPPFPGNESNYLRAQIARISAGTLISPVGFYQFDEDEEEDSSGNRSHVVVNAEYEPLPVRDLADPSNWVHHVLHILPQGRTRWWNPVQKSSGDQDNDDDEEEREDQEEIEPEVGPPLLTPLSEDAELCGMSPWSTQISSKLIAQYSIAVVHSSLWPGAHTFGTGRQFETIYVGWGHKYSPENYEPPPMTAVQNEYSTGPEITEALDPTPEEEAALRAETAPNAGLDADEDEAQDGPNGNDDELPEDEEDED